MARGWSSPSPLDKSHGVDELVVGEIAEAGDEVVVQEGEQHVAAAVDDSADLQEGEKAALAGSYEAKVVANSAEAGLGMRLLAPNSLGR